MPVPLSHTRYAQVLTHDAQAQAQPAQKGPRYKLTINNKDYTHVTDSITVNYSGDGQSGMTFKVDGSLEGMGDSQVSLHLGYGKKMVEYFTGLLEEPDDDPKTDYATAVAYGPFKEMGTQYFGAWVDYSGQNLGSVIHDLSARSGFPNGTIRVVNPSSFTFPTLTFNEENTLLEAAQKAIKDAGYIFVDRPGYQREALPTPRPAVGAPVKARYTEKHYEAGAFTLKPQAVSYASVVVFHRGTVSQWSANQTVAGGTYVGPGDGTVYKAQGSGGTTGAAAPSWPGQSGGVSDNTVAWQGFAKDPAGVAPAGAGTSTTTATQTQSPPFDDIRATAPVRTPGKHRPPANRIFFVPDFTGTQGDAQAMAHLTAERLTHGLFDFQLTAAINPGLFIYDAIQVSRVKLKGSRYVRQTFVCTIDKTVQMDVKTQGFDMTLSGTAVMLSEKPVTMPKLPAPPPTNHVGVLPSPQPFYSFGQQDIFLSQVATDFAGLLPSAPSPYAALYPSSTLYPSPTLYPHG